MSSFITFLNVSFSEADNAIIGLNGKGPLYWRVTYAIQRKKLLEDYSELNLLKSEIEEQIQLSDAMAGLITSSPTIRQTREAQTGESNFFCYRLSIFL